LEHKIKDEIFKEIELSKVKKNQSVSPTRGPAPIAELLKSKFLNERKPVKRMQSDMDYQVKNKNSNAMAMNKCFTPANKISFKKQRDRVFSENDPGVNAVKGAGHSSLTDQDTYTN
jgi:hypothetical protein